MGITTDNKHLILVMAVAACTGWTPPPAGADSVVVKDSSGEVDNLNELGVCGWICLYQPLGQWSDIQD